MDTAPGTLDDEDPKYCLLRLSLDLGGRHGEPTEYILDFQGRVVIGDNADTVVGTLSLCVVDLLEAYESGEQAWEVLDSLRASIAHLCPLVSTSTGLYKPSVQEMAGEEIGRLLVIDHLALKPGYRGKGIGLAAINIACQRFGSICSMAALRAFPTQWEGRVAEGPKEFRRDRTKLMRHYRSAGFKPVVGDGIMVKALGFD